MYWITGILGLALAAAPFVLNYSDNAAALWTSLVVGGTTIVASGIEWLKAGREQWEYWAVVILGLVAVMGPFVFGFGSHATAMWTSVIVGALITLFAGSKLSTGRWGSA